MKSKPHLMHNCPVLRAGALGREMHHRPHVRPGPEPILRVTAAVATVAQDVHARVHVGAGGGEESEG